MLDMLNMEALLTGSINRISHVYRYSSIPVTRRESVAEHSWYVAFYAYMIARDLSGDLSKEVNINFGLLLARAVVHDVDESHTGDFLRIVKYSSPDVKKALDGFSTLMVDSLVDELGVGFSALWESAKVDDLEGQIIQIADLACVASYVIEELELGNRHVKHILVELAKYFSTFIKDHESSLVRPYAHEILRVIRRYDEASCGYVHSM